MILENDPSSIIWYNMKESNLYQYETDIYDIISLSLHGIHNIQYYDQTYRLMFLNITVHQTAAVWGPQ